jgi:hypothetical protein
LTDQASTTPAADAAPIHLLLTEPSNVCGWHVHGMTQALLWSRPDSAARPFRNGCGRDWVVDAPITTVRIHAHDWGWDADRAQWRCLTERCEAWRAQGNPPGTAPRTAQETLVGFDQSGIDHLEQRLQEQASGRANDAAQLLADIRGWWEGVSTKDADAAATKALEYGSMDLEIMGAAMQSLFPGVEGAPPEERRRIGLDMALAFYTLGKVSRTFGAYAEGRIPSDDTWHDVTVYSMMARRIRDTGRWT